VRFHTTWLILAVAGQAVAGPSATEVRDTVRAYRQQHEPAIVGEFAQLLAIPNLAADTANIRKNAELIAQALRERKVETKLLELEGAPPVVFGKLDVPGATRTLTFYVHYDGQPTRQSGWTTEPFQPTLRRPDGSVVDLRSLPQRLDPESRLYARSASDDKAPIIAILAALDALRASDGSPTSTCVSSSRAKRKPARRISQRC
jgi:acetylornithine deacetylase/succinyl-diaminopimelate desuccinylase-like protein